MINEFQRDNFIKFHPETAAKCKLYSEYYKDYLRLPPDDYEELFLTLLDELDDDMYLEFVIKKDVKVAFARMLAEPSRFFDFRYVFMDAVMNFYQPYFICVFSYYNYLRDISND